MEGVEFQPRKLLGHGKSKKPLELEMELSKAVMHFALEPISAVTPTPSPKNEVEHAQSLSQAKAVPTISSAFEAEQPTLRCGKARQLAKATVTISRTD